jgi:kinesin family protein C2/C3
MYEISVQMIEIYNEQIRDLLCSNGPEKKYPFCWSIIELPTFPYQLKLLGWIGWCMQLNMVPEPEALIKIITAHSNAAWGSLHVRGSVGV